MPHHEELPRLAALDDDTLVRVRSATVHSPDATGNGNLIWTLTLSDADGAPVSQERLSAPDWPIPLADIIAPHLDVAGLRVAGEWRTDLGEDGLPQHSAQVRPAD